MAADRSLTLGLLLTTTNDPYETELFQGVWEAAHAAGARLICYTSGALHSHRGFEARRNVIYELVDARVADGLVVSGTLAHSASYAEVEELCRRYRPLPLATVALPLPNAPGVLVDSGAGMRAAVTHLIETHGYQRVAFIRGPEGQREAEDRYQAYQSVLAAHGLPVLPALVAQGDYTRASGADAMCALLARLDEPPRAVAVANDAMALGALDVLRSAGLRVPHDVALTGFDDVDEGRCLDVPLTTVRQVVREQGRQAAQLVLSQIRGLASTAEQVLASATLVVRHSCGCAPPITEQENYRAQAQAAVQARLRTEQQATVLRGISETLVTTFDMADLLDAITELLPRAGVTGGYLSLYEDPQHPAADARLVLAFNRQDRSPLPHNGVRFASPHLVPEGLLPARPAGCLVVEALYSKEGQVGFVVLDVPPESVAVCDAVRGLLSSVLQGVLLVQQRRQIEDELRQHHDQLENVVAARTRAWSAANERLHREIAERRKIEAARRELETLYRQAIAAAGAVPYYRDHQRRVFTFMGEGIKDLTGYTAEEMTIELWNAIEIEIIMLGEAAGLSTTEAIAQARAGKINWRTDSLIRAKDGQTRWVSDTSVEVMGESGESIGSMGILQDVTERRTAEENIRRLNETLEQRVEARTHELESALQELEGFSYSLSHNLRAPLRALDGYAHWLAQDYAHLLDAEALHALQRIRRGAQHMGRVIDDLRTLYRVGWQTLRLEWLSAEEVQALWQVAAETAQAAEPQRPVLVTIGDLPACHADAALLKQMMGHLLSNAFKYTRACEAPRIEIGHTPEAYFVRDNGAGFDMRYASKLFGVFQRLHITEEFEGTGVGLAIVQRVIQRHGGRIWAEAEVNQGATFYFTLPPPQP